MYLDCISDMRCCERICSGPSLQTRKCLDCVQVQCPECLNDRLLRRLDLERELDTPSDPSYRPLPRSDRCSACISATRCCETHCPIPFLPTLECFECMDNACPECLKECPTPYERHPGEERELDTYRRRHIGPRYNRARYPMDRGNLRRRPRGA